MTRARPDTAGAGFFVPETLIKTEEFMGEPKTLRQVRAARMLSQEKLAKLAGLTRVTVQRIEAGAVVPHNGSIASICAALSEDPTEILEFARAIQSRAAA